MYASELMGLCQGLLSSWLSFYSTFAHLTAITTEQNSVCAHEGSTNI